MNREEVEKILRTPENHGWQVQGFGMLRTYFGDGLRLQIWDQRISVWGNNAIHDHPWNFHSTIVSGILYNQRFREIPQNIAEKRPDIGMGCQRVLIQPGSEGGQISEPESIRLWTDSVEVYGSGECYQQKSHELHMTRYQQGTITLLERERVRDKDVAYSIWPINGVPWTFYKPRDATEEEIRMVISQALTWFA